MFLKKRVKIIVFRMLCMHTSGTFETEKESGEQGTILKVTSSQPLFDVKPGAVLTLKTMEIEGGLVSMSYGSPFAYVLSIWHIPLTVRL